MFSNLEKRFKRYRYLGWDQILKGVFFTLLVHWTLTGCAPHKGSVTSAGSRLPHSSQTPSSSTSEKSNTTPPPRNSTTSTQPVKSKEGKTSVGENSEPEGISELPDGKKPGNISPQKEEGPPQHTVPDNEPKHSLSNQPQKPDPPQPLPSPNPSNVSPSPRNGHNIPVLKSPSKETTPVLTPEISEKENGQMINDFNTKITETEKLLTKINQRALTKEQKDTLVTVHNFLLKAKEAFAQKDFPMALNLVEKAHTLTSEIVSNAPE